MKMSIVRVVVFMLALCFSSAANAQRKIPEALKKRLEGKTKLTEIMKEVDGYYANEGKADVKNTDEEESNPYLHWKRWEWWMSSHLDENGDFIKNISKYNYEGMNDADRRWGGEIAKALAQTNARVQKTTAQREQEAEARTARASDPEAPNLAFGDWSYVGPTAEGTTVTGDIKGLGRLDRIAFHPTNSGIIYVGAPSGNLWKTTDGGISWSSVTDGLPTPGIAGVVVSPSSGNTVYILTGDGDSYNPGYLVYDFGSSRPSIGVYKSTDGGASWTKMGPLYTGAGDYEGHRLAISSTNSNYVFATTSQGIYRTTNGGTTWEQVKTGEHWDIEFKPGSDSVVYATSGSAIFYSTQGGRTGTWLTATTDFSVAAARRIELAVSPNNPNYVYALCGAVPATGTFTGIFRSANSGVSYTRRTNAPNILGSTTSGSGTSEQSDYDLGICVKPSDAERVATCGLCVWRSTASNGASAMTFSTIYRESLGAASAYIHPDVHDVQYNPLNNNLYAATDGGFYRSTDDGVTWTNLSAGINTSQFYGMSMRDTDANGEAEGLQILAGAQDNGIKHRTAAGGSVFNHVICCDGYGTAISGDNGNLLYYNINSSFYRSTDGGNNSTFVVGATFFSAVAIDYFNPDTVYLGGSTTRRSYDGFVTTNLSITQNTRRVLTTCPSNTARLYGSSGTNIIRSDDRIATWTVKSGNPGWPAGTFTINDIDVHPSNSLEVYTCFGGYSAGNKIMRSIDGGDNWTNWSGTLPNVPCYGLAVATEGVYAGTELGVFFRGYTMTDWVPFYNQLPRTPVTELVVNTNGLIYASTFGRGIWLSTRRTACANAVLVSGFKTGAYYYEANQSVTATMTTAGTNGDEIFVQSGDSVMLNPGFEVKAGSYFKAYIAPCSNGGIPVAARAAADAVIVPRLTEIPAEKQQPVSNNAYFRMHEGKIEIHITDKSQVQMMAKMKDGSWQSFYPEQTLYPGLYTIPEPHIAVPEVKVMINGTALTQIK